MRISLVALGMLLLSGGCHQAATPWERESMTNTPETGFIAKTVQWEGTECRYAIYVPPEYDASQPWPLILFLHGKGERGVDGVRQTETGIGPAIRAHPERFPCIVVMPQCQPDQKWEGPMLDMALRTLDLAIAEYNIDDHRIVLGGLSMGGFGTWRLGAMHPERFCALAPICGGGETGDAAKLAGLPIWCYHGADDPVVPVVRSREMVEAVKAAGGRVIYTELPGVTHNSWDSAYGSAEYIAWVLAQRRE